jgi:phosphate uptake regulator
MDEARKIQKTGRSTFIVSLPSEWVDKKGVNKGDAVYIEENENGSLTLSLKKSERAPKSSRILVSSQSFESSLRNVVSAYVGGADKIVLRGQGISTVAEEARRILSGVEIAEETGEEITLQILTFETLSIDTIFKRSFNVTQGMFTLAMGSYRTGEDSSVELSRKEDEVDRLYLLLLRNLSTGNSPSNEAVFKAIAAKGMEKISDHVLDLCVSGKSVMPDQRIANLLEKSSKVYICAFDSFSKKEVDSKEFSDAKEAYISDFKKIDHLLKKEKDASKMLVLKSLSEKCNKIVRYSEDIMESGCDLVFSKEESQTTL